MRLPFAGACMQDSMTHSARSRLSPVHSAICTAFGFVARPWATGGNTGPGGCRGRDVGQRDATVAAILAKPASCQPHGVAAIGLFCRAPK